MSPDPRRITPASVRPILAQHPEGVSSLAVSVALQCPPDRARAVLRRLVERGGCARTGDLFRPLRGAEVQAQVLALLLAHPDQEFGHQGVRQALPWLGLSPGAAEGHLQALHAAGHATHAHDPSDDPWHWYGCAQ